MICYVVFFFVKDCVDFEIVYDGLFILSGIDEYVYFEVGCNLCID